MDSEKLRTMLESIATPTALSLGTVETSVGMVVSMTIAFDALIEFAPPGAGNVNTALFPDPSRIVPPLSAKAFVDA
jgi:hypothetical protein